MQFASAIARSGDPKIALEQLLAGPDGIDATFTRGMADLVLVYVSEHFADEFTELIEKLTSAIPNALMIGCTAEGTIGGGQELERMPSVSLFVASLPGVTIRPFSLKQAQYVSFAELADWERVLGVSPDSNATIIAHADPFAFDVMGFVDSINEMYPGSPLLGGIASGGSAPGENRLIADGRILNEGIVGVSLTGNLNVDTVVSQGCRPIGKPFVVTAAERNIMMQLGGRSPLEQLKNVLEELPERDRDLASRSLFVGRVIDEYKEQFERGDFLIHNIIGLDRESGALAIAGPVRVGTTVHFHTRDATTADEDLRQALAPHENSGVRGAVLYDCNGRGTRMWKTPNHDVSVLREIVGTVPVGGFFCGGEFGPIGGTNFVHGFTASIGLFRDSKNPPGEVLEESASADA